MMDNVSECIRKVKHNLSKDLNLIGTLTPPTTDPDSPASSDAQNSDFIDILNEQTNTSTTASSASSTKEDCASTSSTNSKGSSIICKWMNCDWPGHCDDLVDHIREIHVDLQPYHYHDQVNSTSTSNYVCFWQGCKVYGKSSLCKSWLENHVLQHSGPRPFKCIFENCGQRFKTRALLEKHVNNHFANSNCDCTNPSDCTHQDSQHINGKMNGDHLHLAGAMLKRSLSGLAIASPSSTPSKSMLKKKKKLKRRLVNVKTNNDLFDDCTMHRLKGSLIQLNSITGLDIIGDQRILTFHAKVVAKCQEAKSGLVKLLLRWQPEDIIDDQWVAESDASKMLIKKLPINSLPPDTVNRYINRIKDMFFLPTPEIRVKQRRK